MRILLTTDTIGGVWTFTRELSSGLLGSGHAVALVSVGRPPSAEQAAWCAGQMREYRGAFRFECGTAPLEWMQTNETAYCGSEALLLRVADEFGADVLHTNQFCFGKLPVGIPRVVTAHSDVLSWAAACRGGALPASGWLDRYCVMVQEGLDGADAVVAPTGWMLDALGRHFEVPPCGRVIPNGRTLGAGTRAGPRKLQAASVGRLWDEAKNVVLLTKIDAPIPFFVAGECVHEEVPHEAQLGGLTALGLLGEGGLMALFRESSIYVVSSVYEPFGLAPLEAALCGCAVVANDLPSLREVWGDAAIYFRGAAELTAALGRLAACPEELQRARAAANRRAKQLSAGRMVDAYVALYSRLCTPVGAIEEVVCNAS